MSARVKLSVALTLLSVLAACSSPRYGPDESPRKAPWGEVEIHVVAAGQPVAGATVQIYSRDPEGASFRGSRWRWGPPCIGSLETNAQGFARAEVECFSITVEASHARFLPKTTDAQLTGGRASVTIDLAPAQAIAGIVVDGQGKPVAGVGVEITSERLQSNEHTDAQGHFRFEGLAPGKYQLKPFFVPLAFLMPCEPVTVEAPCETAKLELTKFGGSIAIDFVLPKGASFDDRVHASLEIREGEHWVDSPARLWWWPPRATAVECYSQIPAGTYRLTPRMKGFRAIPTEAFEVNAQKQVSIKIELAPE